MCSPEGRDCIEEAKNYENTVGCENSCEGIYADVCKLDDKEINNSNYNAMIAKYTEYKRGFVKNIGFNGSNYRTAFGKRTFVLVKRLFMVPS